MGQPSILSLYFFRPAYIILLPDIILPYTTITTICLRNTMQRLMEKLIVPITMLNGLQIYGSVTS